MSIATSHTKINFNKLREDFPILEIKPYGKPLIYFDNAATSQKPQVVIDRLTKFYQEENSNIHRGVYYLSQVASEAYENARIRVQKHLNAKQSDEIVFVKGATEGINLVAASWGRKNIKAGDEILITEMEHHANIVPWQLLCEEKGATLKAIPVDGKGELILEELEKLLSRKTKLLSLVYASNTLGTINPIKEIIAIAHSKGIPVLVDACQVAPHKNIDVQDLDCDFLVFSGHKVYAPTGIGVLFGKMEHLVDMPPYQGGGDMIDEVTLQKTTFKEPPHRFEAGTPPIAAAIALHTALDYITEIGIQNIAEREQELLVRLTTKMEAIEGVKIIGNSSNKTAIVSFITEGAHPLDIGTFLDLEGIAIRTGNHCTQPLHARFGISATARASLAFFNTEEEIDSFTNHLSNLLIRLRK